MAPNAFHALHIAKLVFFLVVCLLVLISIFSWKSTVHWPHFVKRTKSRWGWNGEAKKCKFANFSTATWKNDGGILRRGKIPKIVWQVNATIFAIFEFHAAREKRHLRNKMMPAMVDCSFWQGAGWHFFFFRGRRKIKFWKSKKICQNELLRIFKKKNGVNFSEKNWMFQSNAFSNANKNWLMEKFGVFKLKHFFTKTFFFLLPSLIRTIIIDSDCIRHIITSTNHRSGNITSNNNNNPPCTFPLRVALVAGDGSTLPMLYSNNTLLRVDWTVVEQSDRDYWLFKDARNATNSMVAMKRLVLKKEKI